MKKSIAIFALAAFVGLGASRATAGPARTEISVPQSLEAGLTYLLSYAGDKAPKAFDADLAGRVVDFLDAPKQPDAIYRLGTVKGAASAFHQVRLDTNLSRVIKLAFNPQIPSYITNPSSVRLSYWTRVGDGTGQLPKLWNFLPTTQPIIVRGVEYMENTPDLHSGAYYAYDLNRALILTRHRGNNVLISISRQRDRSDVGKKGMVLGADKDWNYLYSGLKGITKPGLGWVDSYMYDSASVLVYYETAGPTPTVSCGIFKWLRAGWMGINMVRPTHIFDGLERFARTFKQIIESPDLQDLDALSRAFARIEALPASKLREKSRRYLSRLAKRFGPDIPLCQKWYDELFSRRQYLDQLKRPYLQSIVSIEYLKQVLGKGQDIGLGYLDPPPSPAKG